VDTFGYLVGRIAHHRRRIATLESSDRGAASAKTATRLSLEMQPSCDGSRQERRRLSLSNPVGAGIPLRLEARTSCAIAWRIRFTLDFGIAHQAKRSPILIER